MRNFHNNPPIGKRKSFKVRNIPVPLPQGKCTKSVHFCLLQFLFTRKIFRKLLLLFRRIRIRTQNPEPHNVDLLTPSWWQHRSIGWRFTSVALDRIFSATWREQREKGLISKGHYVNLFREKYEIINGEKKHQIRSSTCRFGPT